MPRLVSLLPKFVSLLHIITEGILFELCFIGLFIRLKKIALIVLSFLCINKLVIQFKLVFLAYRLH